MTAFGYSVVIPAYNAAATIGAAIDSILAQTVAPRLVIVVDDGSQDTTADIALAYGEPVSVIRQSNRGVSAATNAGLACVTTPLVAFLDADDLWHEEKAGRQLAALTADATLDGVFAKARHFRDGSAPAPDAPLRDFLGRTTLMVRSEGVRRVGPLTDPPGGGGRGDMVDWIARAREAGLRFAVLPDGLAYRRIRANSMSYGRDSRDIGYLMAAKQALDRRRAQREDK